MRSHNKITLLESIILVGIFLALLLEIGAALFVIAKFIAAKFLVMVAAKLFA